MDQKKQKEELYGLIGLYSFFIVVLVLVDIFYSAWSDMSTALKGLAFVAHILLLTSYVIILKEWEDPKFDIVRKWFFGFFIVALAFTAGFRVAHNELNMFQGDVDKAKQEQVK